MVKCFGILLMFSCILFEFHRAKGLLLWNLCGQRFNPYVVASQLFSMLLWRVKIIKNIIYHHSNKKLRENRRNNGKNQRRPILTAICVSDFSAVCKKLGESALIYRWNFAKMSRKNFTKIGNTVLQNSWPWHDNGSLWRLKVKSSSFRSPN